MVKEIKKSALDKLRIYITPTDKVRQGKRSFLRKLFPKSAYIHIVAEAGKDGILVEFRDSEPGQ